MADDHLLFGELMLAMINESRRVGTHKLVLLLALMDALVADSDEEGSPPAVLSTRTVAVHMVEVLWLQTRPYGGPDESVLSQYRNRGQQAEMVKSVEELRAAASLVGASTALAARQSAPAAWDRCIVAVERTAIRNPIPRLQRVDGLPDGFLYSIGWKPNDTPDGLRRRGVRLELEFAAGAASRLVSLAPLLRPLIESHFVESVADWNGLAREEQHLRAHLFGADRVSFSPRLRDTLRELQNGRCFYTGQPLPRDGVHVDHFLPWSRHPINAIENLVLTSGPVNLDKRNLYPAAAHVQDWVDTVPERKAAAHEAQWDSDADRVTSTARAAYRHLPDCAPLWGAPNPLHEPRQPRRIDSSVRARILLALASAH